MATAAQIELQELVAAAQAGDRASFERLVARTQDTALAFCFGQIGQRELARDAAQDAFVDAFLHLDQLAHPAAFLSWFRRVLLKHCDRRSRRKVPDPQQLEHHVQSHQSATAHAEATLLERERANWLWTAIEALPDHERTAVALHYTAGLSLEEIANLLEVNANTVKQRLHSARQRVRARSLSVMSEQLSHWKASSDATFSNHVAFFMAIRTGDVASVRTLLTREPSLRDAQEHWDHAAWSDRDLPVANRSSPLIRAAESGHVPVLQLLLDAGADVDGHCGCQTGESPLWAAVVTGQVGTARELLQRGANPCARASSGVACLHIAAMRGSRELIELLLEHGADREQRDAEGRSALDWLRIKGHTGLSPLLGAHRSSVPTGTRELPAGGSDTLYATGIKAIDLLAPLHEGGFTLVHGGAGVGRNILLAELAHVAHLRPDTMALWVMWPRELWSDAELDGLLNETDLREKVQVLRPPEAIAAEHARELPARALASAERALAQGTRHVQLTFFERPGVRTAVESILPSLGRRSDGTAISAFVVPPLQLADQYPGRCTPPFDAYLGFDRELARAQRFPALHAGTSDSRLLRERCVSARHVALAAQTRALLTAVDGATAGDEPHVRRARQLRAYFTQPFAVAEPFSGRLGIRVEYEQLLADVGAILDGAVDSIEETRLLYGGGLDSILRASR